MVDFGPAKAAAEEILSFLPSAWPKTHEALRLSISTLDAAETEIARLTNERNMAISEIGKSIRTVLEENAAILSASEARLERLITIAAGYCQCGACHWCPQVECVSNEETLTQCKAHIRAWLDTPEQEAINAVADDPDSADGSVRHVALKNLRPLTAETEIARLRDAYTKISYDVEQTLGKALGYPWYKDDQKNCPGATAEHGVCVGENVPEVLAEEAANRIARLTAELKQHKRALRHEADFNVHWRYSGDEREREVDARIAAAKEE